MREYPEVPLKEETYLWVGQHFYDSEAWAAASEAFSALISHVPNYANLEGVLFLIAECSENSGTIDQAIEDFQRVVTAAPDSVKAVEARYRAAQLHEKNGALETAMALYEKAANANNGDLAARARFRLAELYETSGDLDKASRSYMIVVILFLHEELSPEALWRSARCYSELGNTEKQQSSLDELLREYPESTQATLVREHDPDSAKTISPKSDVASVEENSTTN